MKAYEMAVLPGRWSMEMGPPTPQPTDEICAAPETSLTSHCRASRRAATPRFADTRTPVIPPGYQQIPGYEAYRQRQEARALMGSIAERRGSLGAARAGAFAGARAQQLANERTWTISGGAFCWCFW
ncbi:unnamed protein product [Penicillium palitans]